MEPFDFESEAPRINELLGRLEMPGGKAEHLSLSELMEVVEATRSLLAREENRPPKKSGLRPCACGSKDLSTRYDGHGHLQVVCDKCGVVGSPGLFFKNCGLEAWSEDERAWDAWNRDHEKLEEQEKQATAEKLKAAEERVRLLENSENSIHQEEQERWHKATLVAEKKYEAAMITVNAVALKLSEAFEFGVGRVGTRTDGSFRLVDPVGELEPLVDRVVRTCKGSMTAEKLAAVEKKYDEAMITVNAVASAASLAACIAVEAKSMTDGTLVFEDPVAQLKIAWGAYYSRQQQDFNRHQKTLGSFVEEIEKLRNATTACMVRAEGGELSQIPEAARDLPSVKAVHALRYDYDRAARALKNLMDFCGVPYDPSGPVFLEVQALDAFQAYKVGRINEVAHLECDIRGLTQVLKACENAAKAGVEEEPKNSCGHAALREICALHTRYRSACQDLKNLRNEHDVLTEKVGELMRLINEHSLMGPSFRKGRPFYACLEEVINEHPEMMLYYNYLHELLARLNPTKRNSRYGAHALLKEVQREMDAILGKEPVFQAFTAPATPPSPFPRVGERWADRTGRIHGPLQPNDNPMYPLIDPTSRRSWTWQGIFSLSGLSTELDLVSPCQSHEEPKPDSAEPISPFPKMFCTQYQGGAPTSDASYLDYSRISVVGPSLKGQVYPKLRPRYYFRVRCEGKDYTCGVDTGSSDEEIQRRATDRMREALLRRLADGR